MRQASGVRALMAFSAAVAFVARAAPVEPVEGLPERELMPRPKPKKPRNQFHADPTRTYFDSGKPMSKRAKRRGRGKGKSHD